MLLPTLHCGPMPVVLEKDFFPFLQACFIYVCLRPCSCSPQATESQLVRQLEQLQAEVERARRDMGDVEGDHERLKRERQDLQIELTAVQMELKEVRGVRVGELGV